MASRNSGPLLRPSLTVKDFRPMQTLCEYACAQISHKVIGRLELKDQMYVIPIYKDLNGEELMSESVQSYART